MRIFVLFILCFFSFIFFPFGFLVWKFDVLFVDLLVFVFSYGHSKQTRSLLLLVHGVQSVTLRFYPRPENLFLVTDGRSEGGVPANTLKRLVRKRKYKNIFQKKMYSEVGFELLPTKKSTIIIRMLYPLSYSN